MMNVIKNILLDWDQYLKLHRCSKVKKVILFFLIFFHNPGMLFSVLYRIERSLYNSRYFKVIYYFFYPFYFFITYYILDIDIHPSVKIGYGLYIHNKGIIVANDTEIGNYASFIGPITIGINSNKPGHAKIGHYVSVSTGARVIGPVSIGNNVVIGANAVVTKDFGSNVILGGVPAIIIKHIK